MDQEGRWQGMLLPSIKVGAASGVSGVFVGGTVAILRGSTAPVLFMLASGAQWFCLDGAFWAGRSDILRILCDDHPPSPRERLYASTAAGGVAGGTVGALFRGRRNIIPGIVMFSLLGLCGQTVFNAVDASRKERAADEVVERQSLMKRIANARWSPMQNLSDEQYVSMLKEKLLSVEVEIAVIDDKISELRGAETKSKEQGPRR